MFCAVIIVSHTFAVFPDPGPDGSPRIALLLLTRKRSTQTWQVGDDSPLYPSTYCALCTVYTRLPCMSMGACR